MAVKGAGEDADGVDNVATLALEVTQLPLLHVFATHNCAMLEWGKVAALLCGIENHHGEFSSILARHCQNKEQLYWP